MTTAASTAGFLDRRDSEHRDGLDILRFKLELEGIETQERHLAAGHTMLVRSLGDGTSFILTGRGRQNYSIGRFADDDDISPPTHFAEHLTSDSVVAILTFAEDLPEYDAATATNGVNFQPWHLTPGARSA
jgi:hypothetical protein